MISYETWWNSLSTEKQNELIEEAGDDDMFIQKQFESFLTDFYDKVYDEMKDDILDKEA